MSRFVVGRELQAQLPWVFRLNPTAPSHAVYSDRWVDDGWVRLCESSSREALDHAVAVARGLR